LIQQPGVPGSFTIEVVDPSSAGLFALNRKIGASDPTLRDHPAVTSLTCYLTTSR